jgi:Ca2+-binding EF-hand superfamily protein
MGNAESQDGTVKGDYRQPDILFGGVENHLDDDDDVYSRTNPTSNVNSRSTLKTMSSDSEGNASNQGSEDEEDDEEEEEDDEDEEGESGPETSDDEKKAESTGNTTESDEESVYQPHKPNLPILDTLNLYDMERDRSQSMGNRSDYSVESLPPPPLESPVNRKKDVWEQSKIEASKVLTLDEIIRAERVFYHCDTYNDRGLSEDQLCNALALLGQIEKVDEIRELFHKYKCDPMPKHIFLKVLCDLRQRKLTDGQTEAIEHAFEAIYQGSCPDDTNRDDSGRKFVLASDLRRFLISLGDKLSDEDADMLIRECHPIYVESAEGVRKGRIFLEQYRSLLLDKSS